MPKFKQFKFIIIQSTNELNKRAMIGIKFKNAQERSEFVRAHDPIKLDDVSYQMQLHQDDNKEDLLVVIRLPLDGPEKKQISPKVKDAMLNYFKTHCADAYDFDKQIETTTLYPNQTTSKLEKTATAMPRGQDSATKSKSKPQPKPTYLGLFLALGFLKAPSKYPLGLGLIAAALSSMGAYYLALTWMSTLIVSAAIFSVVLAAVLIRNRVYQQEENRIEMAYRNFEKVRLKGFDYKIYHKDLENRAFLDGLGAGSSWTCYFKSFDPRQGWVKHPIIFGAGMMCAIKRQEAKENDNMSKKKSTTPIKPL